MSERSELIPDERAPASRTVMGFGGAAPGSDERAQRAHPGRASASESDGDGVRGRSPRATMKRLLLGALCGAAWGVAARVWMRLITTTPEFTWSGTLSIVGATTVAGLGMGAV